jgi:hypothetical protein
VPLFWERVGNLEAVHDVEEVREAAAAMGDALRPLVGPAADALFGACDALSAEPYEGAEARGTLLLVARGHPAVDVLFELADPTPLLAARAARKTLELSRGVVAPLCDGTVIWGVGRVARPYDPARRDLFEVRFDGRARWELRHAGERVLAVEGHAAPRPAPSLPRARFEAVARQVVGVREATELARLWEAVAAVLATGRGCTVVVSAGAAAEAERLAHQGTRIAPHVLAPEALQAATGIGGALLLDAAGVCHAIGVILDGIAGADGTRARGSRFNSAASYVRGRPATLAVVVSDDGSVDLLASEAQPGPPPRGAARPG